MTSTRPSGDPLTAPSADTGPNPAALTAWRVLLYAYTLALLLALFLAGAAAWGVPAGVADSPRFDAHSGVGMAAQLLALLMLVAAALARASRRVVVLSAVLLVLTGLQSLWAGLAEDSRWLGGVHTVTAGLVLAVAVSLHRKPA